MDLNRYLYYSDSLEHHGIKGQKWGVKNGPPYPLNEEDHSKREKKANWEQSLGKSSKNVNKSANKKTKEVGRDVVTNYYKKKLKKDVVSRGKKIADRYLEEGTEFSRIQIGDVYEPYAFYATYKDWDKDKYAGLYGRNLQRRYKDSDQQVYQLTLKAKKKIAIPSEDSAADTMMELMSDSTFRDNLIASIEDSKTIKRSPSSTLLLFNRPSQQMLLAEALKALKSGRKLSNTDKKIIYRAFNLSLTIHNEQEVAAQNAFYSALKKKGYSALADLNDSTYSSYHAKDPIIVFDLDKIKFQSATTLDSKYADRMYKIHTTDRYLREIPEQTIGNIAKFSGLKISQVGDYVSSRIDDYFNA